MKKPQMVSAGIAFVFAITFSLHAQTTAISIQSLRAASADDRAVMAIEETPPLPAESIPPWGTFWSVQHPDWAPLSGNINNSSVWDLGSGVDLLEDQDFDYVALEQQDTTLHMLARAAGLETEGDEYASFSAYSFATDGLWLEISGVSNGLAYLNLHNATDSVYEVWSKIDLLATNWDIEQAVWPDTNQTVTPFTVPQLNRETLFIWARDWTGITSGGNQTPEWWFWKYFHTINLSDTNLDNQGNTLWYDYTNNLDPNVISFFITVTNNYVKTAYPTLQLNIDSGVPDYEAILVNDTNVADAVWQPYTGSNVVATLGADGNYNVSVGLRGWPSNATVSWESVALVKQTIAPLLTITSPTNSTISQSPIQLQGYAGEPLSSLSFDVSNATGIFTNEQGFLTGQFYDTNLLAFTTNYFQCSDIDLADGQNIVTLHATDWAGNRTDAGFTLTYSAGANPPALAIVWPQPDTAISGCNFTVQAQVDSTAAKITASIVDSSGDTNIVQGLIEKNGSAWIQNVPLNTGTNSVTVTTTGLNGSTSVGNFNVVKNDVGLVIYPLEDYQLNQPSVNVFGEIGDPSLCVWVNGVQASVDEYGDWEADNVPVSPVGTATLSVQVYVGDPVLVASQSFYQAQPVTVGMMSYSGAIHINSLCPIWWSIYAGTGDDVINWYYLSGGNDHCHGTTTSPDGPPVSDVDYSWAANAAPSAFIPPWEYAETSFGWVNVVSYSGSENGNFSVRTHVMLEPSGQAAKGQTNLYLVRANASEVSDVTRGENFVRFYDLTYDPSWWYGNEPLPPEWPQINGQTLVDSGITNADGSVSGEIIIQAPTGVNMDVTPVATQVHQNLDYTFNVQALDITHVLAVDNNRDGQIALDGSDDTTPTKPFRFWVNDSKESGDDESAGGADDQIPGQSYFNANYSLTHVNGSSDLVNFFPVAFV
jgi:hypothetical protein